jgi:hypothetical protein
VADETLKIRVDLDRATVREFGTAMKEIRAQIKDAAQQDVPALNREYQAIAAKVKELTGRHSEFQAQVKAARTEARTFRFALLELTHGMDGVVNTFATFAGAGEHTEETLKSISSGAKEALGAGLGLKFGMEALGGVFEHMATPVGIAVGALTLAAVGVRELNKSFNEGIEAMEKNRAELLKLDEALGEVFRDLKVVSEEQYLDKMNASLEDLTKRAEEATKAVFSLNIIKSLTSGFAVMDVEQVKKTPQQRQQEALDVANKVKQIKEEEIKGSKAGADAAAKEQEQRDQAVERDLESFDEREKLFQRFLENQAQDQEIANQFAELERKDQAESYKQFLEAEQKDYEVSQGMTGREIPIEEQLGNWMAGIDALSSGFAALSSSIHSGLAQAFGQANSMFEQFLFGVLDGLTSIAERLASSAIIGGLLSFLGLGAFGSLFSSLSGFKFAGGGVINEPVMGVGMRSGRSYSFAERAPERVSPLTAFGGGGGGYNRIEIVGTMRAAGRDLMSSWKETRIIDRKAGGNI